MKKSASPAIDPLLPIARILVTVDHFVPATEGKCTASLQILDVAPYPQPLCIQQVKDANGKSYLRVTGPVVMEFSMSKIGGHYLPIGVGVDDMTKNQPKWLLSFPCGATKQSEADGARVLQVQNINAIFGTYSYEFDLVIQRLKDHVFGIIDPEVTNVNEEDPAGSKKKKPSRPAPRKR